MPGDCTASSKRRLIIRPGAIGDTILGFPAMEHLAAGGPTEIWVRSEILPLVRFADRTRAISATGIDLLGIPGVDPPASLVSELASFREIVSWYGANRPEFREALGSFCKNVRFLEALPPGGSVHAADFFMGQAGGGVPATPRIDLGPVERRPTVVLHPFSGSPGKNWPYERFRELERWYPVEWAAEPDWVRFENLMELARWMAGARVYVGNDSGITHLAAAAGARVIALFGPSDAGIWGPRGASVRIVRARSMAEISIGMVRSAIDRELEQSAPG